MTVANLEQNFLLKVSFLELPQEAKERKKVRAECRADSAPPPSGQAEAEEEQEDDGGGADADNGWEDFQGRQGRRENSTNAQSR